MSLPFKLIVVGATGYIGKHLYSNVPPQFKAIGTSSRDGGDFLSLKLESPSTFNFEIIQSRDVVLLCAAISAPDVCAKEHDRAWAVNVRGTVEFISRAISRGALVIFFSSDTVYGENAEAVNESTYLNPSGEYAEMKAIVEKQFFGNPNFKSIRLSYVFSRDDRFTKYLLQCVKNNEEAEIFHPFNRSVIYRDDVVKGVLALAQRWHEFPQRVFNFGGPEILSRVQFAEYLKKGALGGLRFRILEPEDDFFKNRPRIIAMSSNLLPSLLGRPALTIEEAVEIEFK